MADATITGFSAGSTTRPVDKRLILLSTIFADADPTTSYVASDTLYCAQAALANLELVITRSTSTSFEWYLEWSNDGTTWFRELNISPSSGTNTVYANSYTLGVSSSVNVLLSNAVLAPYLRVNVKRTGGSSSDKVTIKAALLGL